MSLPSHDELKNLFESDPLAFEVNRKVLIDKHINNSNPKYRKELIEMQSKIDNKIEQN